LTPPYTGGTFASMSRKRRSERNDPLEKTGYRIPRSIVMQVREVVSAGQAKSQNEFVERALKRELRVMQQRRLYEEYAQAASDSAWVAEMNEVDSGFDNSLGDGLDGG
jgi:Arc/MetJ-type ribon-helix-helix transcriptional regulator